MIADFRDTHRKFSICFNFSNELIVGLQILQISTGELNCLYIPPYIEDYITNSNQIKRWRDNELEQNVDRDFYFDFINQVNKQFPNRIELILDDNKPSEYQLMFGNLLSEYLYAGFKRFRVGTIEQAQIIKAALPEAIITGAITMHITKNKLEQNKTEYMKYFDKFVLDFPFNRDIDAIKELPKEFKYELPVNANCSIKCSGDFHWFDSFPDRDFEIKDCPYFKPAEEFTFEDSTYIRPMDLLLFDEYIDSYDLCLRETTQKNTKLLLRDFVLYTTDYTHYMPNLNINEELYKKNK